MILKKTASYVYRLLFWNIARHLYGERIRNRTVLCINNVTVRYYIYWFLVLRGAEWPL